MSCVVLSSPILFDVYGMIYDFTANLLTEVCSNGMPLQALTGELLSHSTSNSEDDARLGVNAQMFLEIVTS